MSKAAGLKPSRTEGVHFPPQEVYLPPPCPNRTEGVHLPPPRPSVWRGFISLRPATELMSKAAGPKSIRTEGVYLPPPLTASDNKAAGLKPSRTERVHLPPQEVYLPPPCPNRTEGVHLPPLRVDLPLPAIELIVKAAGLKPRRMEGVYLSTSSNGINEQIGWTEAQPYEAYLSPSSTTHS